MGAKRSLEAFELRLFIKMPFRSIFVIESWHFPRRRVAGIPLYPPQKVAIEFHLYIYNVRDYFYWNTTYLDVVRITFFCPIVTPPLTCLFLLEHHHIY